MISPGTIMLLGCICLLVYFVFTNIEFILEKLGKIMDFIEKRKKK